MRQSEPSDGPQATTLQPTPVHYELLPTPLSPEANSSTSPSSSDTTRPVNNLAPSEPIVHGATASPNYPFARTVLSGLCDAGQLTSGGHFDSSRHGQAQPTACSPVSLEGLTLGLAGGGGGGAQPQPRGSAHAIWHARALSSLRSGDFGIARLGGVAVLNMQRLVYRPSDIAWDTLTSHLLFVFCHPAAPQPIRVQAARTIDDTLVIVPRHLAAPPSDLQAAVWRRMLDVLARQVMLDGTASGISMELRHLGLEALHQILPATPSSPVGKRYSKCSPASAGAPLSTTLGHPPLPRPVPLAVVPRLWYLQEKLARAPSALHQHTSSWAAKCHEADHEPAYSVLWVHLLHAPTTTPPPC
ncbi:hypothetical protein BC826DRAFT_1190901 [Russula brevipes]|nr:hypothetical protein BC826DRAFT_1190901 [Russula brevipes]